MTQEALDQARMCYTNAFLLIGAQFKVSSDGYYQPIISLLDRALQLFPDFLDAKYLREEVWHSFLRQSKGTVNHNDVYNKYINSEAWEDKKTQVLTRDGYRCVCCNTQAVDVPLDVHHKTYDNIGKEPLSDLSSMCKTCHKFADQQRKEREAKNNALNPPQPETTQDEVDRVFPENAVRVPDNVV